MTVRGRGPSAKKTAGGRFPYNETPRRDAKGRRGSFFGKKV